MATIEIKEETSKTREMVKGCVYSEKTTKTTNNYIVHIYTYARKLTQTHTNAHMHTQAMTKENLHQRKVHIKKKNDMYKKSISDTPDEWVEQFLVDPNTNKN